MYELPKHRNLDKAPAQLLSAVARRFCLERAPCLLRPLFPPAADGVAAQFNTAPLPDELENNFDVGDLAI